MSGTQSEFNFPPSYIAGLLDATGRVRFPVSETDDGRFTVHPSLRLYPYQSEMRGNVIGSFLEARGYDYNFIDRADSNDFFRLQFVSELSDLQSYLAGESAHLVRELEFVTETFSEEFDTEILSPESTYRFLQTRDRLRYGWRPKGIHHLAPEEIKTEHAPDIKTEDIDLPRIPNGTFRSGYSIQYIAGLFDGAGRFRPSIGKSDEYEVGYQLHPIVRLYRGGINPTLINHVQQFCADYNLRVGDSSEDTTLNVVFTGAGAIRRLLEVIYPQLLVAAEPAAILDEAVLPRFDDGDHLTKQGFYEILTVLEQLAAQSGGASRDRDYSAEYFGDLWSDTLDIDGVHPAEPEPVAETPEPRTEPNGDDLADDVETVTLDIDVYSDAPGRYQTIVDRHRRDAETVQNLKAMYTDRCQVCGDRRAHPDGTGFSEVHYIRPLGKPHDGPDTLNNMLVLCPNHHADFDNGVIAVDPHSLTVSHPYDRSVDGRSLLVDESHAVNATHLTYHNQEIVSHSSIE